MAKNSHYFRWILVAIVAIHSGCIASGADVDFLLDMADNIPGVSNTFPEWNRANLTMMNKWPGVAWDPNNNTRITQLWFDTQWCCDGQSPGGNARSWRWNGTLNVQAFLRLEGLQIFFMRDVGFLTAEFPNTTLTMPNLLMFQPNGVGLTLHLPDRWPKKLRAFTFNKGRVLGHGPGQLPPLLDSDTVSDISKFECWGCALTCPLPQWLVDRIQNRDMETCAMPTNYFTITNKRVCNQLPAENVQCITTPSIQSPPKPEFFATTQPQFTFGNDLVQAEMYGNAVYIFRKYVNKFTKKVEIYRDEFFGWVMHPWGQLTRAPGADVHSRIFILPDFGPPTQNADGTQFYFNAIYGDGILNITYTFFLGDPEPDIIRFDLQTTSIIDRNDSLGWKAGIAQQYIFRFQHSDNVPLSCVIEAGSFAYKNCTSDIVYADFSYDLAKSQLILNFANPRIKGVMRYPTILTSDGNIVGSGYSDIRAFSEPYGDVDRTRLLSYKDPSPFFSNPNNHMVKAAPEDQHVSVLAMFYIPLWNQKLEYDPEIRLNLLFDPSESAPLSEEQTIAMTGGVIAAIVISVGVAVAGFSFVGLKYVIFPYLQKRDEQVARPITLDDDPAATNSTKQMSPHEEKQSSSRWSAAVRPKSMLDQ